MPDPIIQNPAFANNPPGALYTSKSLDFWALDPNISVATLTLTVATLATNQVAPQPGVGQLVYLQGWDGKNSAASGSPTHPTVALSTTTAQGNLIGVISGVNAPGTGVSAPGQVVQVTRFGLAVVVVDNTCTVGHALVQSTGTAGVLHDSGGVGGTQGETVGFVSEAITVSSGLGATLAFIKLT